MKKIFTLLTILIILTAFLTSCKESNAKRQARIDAQKAALKAMNEAEKSANSIQNNNENSINEYPEESDDDYSMPDFGLKPGNGAKLLSGINYGDGTYMDIGYDEQNRVNKIVHVNSWDLEKTNIISYEASKVIVETIYEFEPDRNNKTIYIIKGNEIIDDDIKMTINNEGNIIRFDNFETNYTATYSYENGNMTEYINHEDNETTRYKYDNKKSMFTNTTSPKWLIQILFSNYDFTASTGNNFINFDNMDFTYDDSGFPTYVEWSSDGGDFWYQDFSYYGN